ncbi:MAG TPA: hypothetical protein VGM90_26045 [Kofleriaceae bacterium]|jgi:hypothetical protein
MSSSSVVDPERRMLALIASVIALINAISVIFDPRDHASLALGIVDGGHLVIALAVVAVTIRSRAWSPRIAEGLFILVVAPFLVGIWLPQSFDLVHGEMVDPLLAHRFLLLGIAVSAPSWRSGAALAAVFMIHAIALATFLERHTSMTALDREPWLTVFFALVAVLLLYTRETRRHLRERLAAAEARAKMLSQVGRVLLALRDRANTPLQTLEIGIHLLETPAEDNDKTLALMRRALVRLAAIQTTLARGGDSDAALLSPPDLEEALLVLRSDEDHAS